MSKDDDLEVQMILNGIIGVMAILGTFFISRVWSNSRYQEEKIVKGQRQIES